ncbi:MAG: LysR family transcriptional regulator [Burkholderiaceae bacterium]|nr:LysR family transcriptional regulator [Burkholderiaceae bacterium]
MSSLRYLRTFLAVAQEGSLAAAAPRVSLTQAAVSLQMRALEAELRRELFDRSGRVLTLNAAGRALLPKAQQLVNLHDELRGGALLADPLTGAYRIGAVVSAMSSLAHAVVALKHRHGQLDVKVISDRSGPLAALVEAGQLDAAVLVKSVARLPSSLAWTPLYQEPLIVLAHPEVRARTAVKALVGQPFLRFDRNERTGALVARALKQVDVVASEFLELNSIEALAELVRQRVGVSLLPRLRRATWEQDPALRVLPMPELSLLREVGLLHRREATGPLIDAIAQEFVNR